MHLFLAVTDASLILDTGNESNFNYLFYLLYYVDLGVSKQNKYHARIYLIIRLNSSHFSKSILLRIQNSRVMQNI